MAAAAFDPAPLEASIGYVFADRELIRLALTHVSATGATRLTAYQRLEFLGDRVLGLVISDMLYAAFPEAEEGELSRRLAALVRKETCAEVAREWGVADHVRLGEGERQTGMMKTAILGDICESIIAAAYLDGGYVGGASVSWRVRSRRVCARPRRPLRDPKSALQEWAQSRGLAAPSYRQVGRTGPDHAPEFTIAVSVAGFADAVAKGASKRLAEQAAAAALMTREHVEIDDTQAKP